MDRKELHDLLMQQKPEDAEHDREACAFCKGAVVDKTYTDAEVRAIVETATAPLKAQLDQIASAAQSELVGGQLAALKAEYDAAVEEIRSQLDTLTLEKQAAVDDLAAFKAEIESAAADELAKQEIADRREGRLAKVREAAAFKEEYLTANGDRWAAMTDDDFQARLEEYIAISGAPGENEIPKRTALTASREPRAGATKGLSQMRELAEANQIAGSRFSR